MSNVVKQAYPVAVEHDGEITPAKQEVSLPAAKAEKLKDRFGVWVAPKADAAGLQKTKTVVAD